VSPGGVRVRRLDDPADRALGELSRLLYATFADPDVVLGLDRMQAFLAEHGEHRRFCVLVAEQGGLLVGGSVFSYVRASNCGFSEYLVVRKDRHRQGIGRLLFEARRAVLDELAQAACTGLFIEADNPERTPAALQASERETALDALTRLHVFAHLGFRKVDVDYVQPGLGPGKQPVTYLDLLFAAWGKQEEASVPATWVSQTVCAIWTSWAPATAAAACAEFRERLGESPVALVNLT
jgi:GNAT superfamily N-acetyltransferase